MIPNLKISYLKTGEKMKKVVKFLPAIISVVLIAVICIVLSVGLTSCGGNTPKEASVPKYTASDTTDVAVYELTENEETKELEATQVFTIPRGMQVNVFPTPVVAGEINYLRLEEEAPSVESDEEPPVHYFLETDLVDDQAETVRETARFVRTSVTVYENPDTPDIASFFKKGTALEVTGFDKINDDGSVEMYKVKSGETEGYVFSKYLVATQEEADAVYTEYYDLNKDKIYDTELYCGPPTAMDYFPYDKSFDTDKEMPAEARTLYMNMGTIDVIDTYIECAKEIGCNAFVIDIKDGRLAYKAEAANEYSPTSYNHGLHDVADYKAAVDKVKAAGIWTIGRIVVFNDEEFAADNPNECIFNNGVNQEWPSAYSRLAWEYNVKLAVAAVEEIGFDEIQFDYVRFPENTFFMSRDGGADFKNTYNEEKAEAIQNFCFYAADQIHKSGAYFSVDVFGECSNGYVTAYGQYWPAISMVVDAISSMPYVDHFGRDVDTWSDYYTTVYNWADKAAEAQTITPNPAVARTWLTCYDVPYWDPVVYANSAFLGGQVQALWDAGIGDGGFITWNAASNLNIYYNVGDAFKRDYTAN